MAGATIQGIPDLREALAGIAPKLRVRALRNALAAGARVVQKAARAATPVLSPGDASVLKGRRTPGLVRKSISVRTSKVSRRAGDVGVFVNVKPAKAALRGAKSKSDPYFWQWLNFGWNPAGYKTGGYGRYGRRLRRKLNKAGKPKIRRGYRFLEAGANKLPEALQVFLKTIGPQIAKLNKPKAPAP